MPQPRRQPATDESLRQLALDYVAGKVYTTQDVPNNLWHMVFIPLFFMQRKDLRGIRMVYARVGEHKTTGQAINGYPIFFACGALRRAELGRFVTFVEEAKSVTQQFLKGKK